LDVIGKADAGRRRDHDRASGGTPAPGRIGRGCDCPI